jgi:hypothetical protein
MYVGTKILIHYLINVDSVMMSKEPFLGLAPIEVLDEPENNTARRPPSPVDLSALCVMSTVHIPNLATQCQYEQVLCIRGEVAGEEHWPISILRDKCKHSQRGQLGNSFQLSWTLEKGDI